MKIKHLEDEIKRLLSASGQASDQEQIIADLKRKVHAAQEKLVEMQDKYAALGKDKVTVERELSVIFVKLEDSERELQRMRNER